MMHPVKEDHIMVANNKIALEDAIVLWNKNYFWSLKRLYRMFTEIPFTSCVTCVVPETRENSCEVSGTKNLGHPTTLYGQTDVSRLGVRERNFGKRADFKRGQSN